MPSHAAQCLELAVAALNGSAGSVQERLRDAWRAVQPLMFSDTMLHAREQQRLRADLFDHFPAGSDLPDDRAILSLSPAAASALAGEIAQLHARFAAEARARGRDAADAELPAEGFYPLDYGYRQPQRRMPGSSPVLSGEWAAVGPKPTA